MTNVLSMAILLSVTVAAGIAIWFYASSRAEIISVQFNEENNAALKQLNSVINLEHYTLSSNGLAKLWIRNIGGTEIVITRFQIFDLSGGLISSTDFTCITILDILELSNPDVDDAECISLGSTAPYKTTKFNIPPSYVDEGVVVLVYILPKDLYNVDLPVINQDRAVIYDYYLRRFGGG